jgi:MOSC domain-containing protein YiiM
VARVEAIWIKKAHRGAMVRVDQARFITGAGIEGNADRSRRRQVTILEAENWDRFMRELGASIDPSARRANLLVSGVALANSRGRTLKIGTVELVIGGETTPCERMDEALPGLREAMRADWGGGVFAQVISGGVVHAGDAITE